MKKVFSVLLCIILVASVFTFGFANGSGPELTVNHVGMGSTSPSGTSTVATGATVRISASPDECWEFSHWRGPVASSSSVVTSVTVSTDTTVTAVFEKIMYPLEVTHEGNGTTDPDGSGQYECGSRVPLRARADRCWEFAYWEGDVESSTHASTSIIMDGPKRVRAVFRPIEYTLSVTHSGEGMTMPSGASVRDCGEVVQLSAEAEECWRFSHWEGDVASTGSAMTTVLMDESKRVRAIFEPVCQPERYRLHVYVHEGDGSTIPSGTSYHLEGTEVDLTAIPDPGWEFVTWRGGPVTSWTTTESSVVINGNTTVAAVFAPISTPGYCTLWVDYSDGGVASPEGETVVTCGTVVDLVAEADSGWYFYQWHGSQVADPWDETTTILVDEDKRVYAEFMYEGQMEDYWLCIEIEGNGDVPWDDGSDSGVHNGDDETWHASGAIVELDPDPASGWYFYRWEGPDRNDVDGDEILMDDNKELVAVFRRRSSPGPIILRERLSISIEGEGTVEPFVGSRSYNKGTVVDVGAEPADDWMFVGWFGPDGNDVSGNQITMNEDKSIIARFETMPPPAPPVEPPEVEIPLIETPLGGGELPDTGMAVPWMTFFIGLGAFSIGYFGKNKER